MTKHQNTPESLASQQNMREKAKKLYASGLSLASAAEILDLPYILLQHWSQADDFRSLANELLMRRNHLRRLLLSSFEAATAGKRPAPNAADLLRYATAYEKLSDANQHLGCWYEAYDQLTDARVMEINALRNEREKNTALRQLRSWRSTMQQLLNKQSPSFSATTNPHA